MKKPEDSYKAKHNLGWGDPYFLMELLSNQVGPLVNVQDVSNMPYAMDDGIERLKDLTKQAILETSGIDYEYIIITAGATQAINSVLKYRYNRGYRSVVTPRYGYPFYSDMIENSGMARVMSDKPYDVKLDNVNPMYLIDSPSNPLGKQFVGDPTKSGLTIWDGVYHSEIYTRDLITYPPHICMVGSYSKLLGLTGARVGWIATDDDFFFERIRDVSLKDNATVSVPSQKMIIEILERLDLNGFTKLGQVHLDYNRDLLSKISYLFDNQPVQETGMFYCANADKKSQEILKKADVSYVTLEENFIRLSLGQTNHKTQAAVHDIIKKDTV